jgi:hypothetical protein
MPLLDVNGLLPGRGARPMPLLDVNGLLPGRGPAGRGAGRGPAAGACGGAAGGAGGAAGGAGGAAGGAGGVGASTGAGAPAADGCSLGGADVVVFLAAGAFLAAFFAAGAFFSGAAGIASLSLRITGASTVEDADFTYSPRSANLANTSLLVTPSSFASSCTRTFDTTLLSWSGQNPDRQCERRIIMLARSSGARPHSTLPIRSVLTVCGCPQRADLRQRGRRGDPQGACPLGTCRCHTFPSLVHVGTPSGEALLGIRDQE